MMIQLADNYETVPLPRSAPIIRTWSADGSEAVTAVVFIVPLGSEFDADDLGHDLESTPAVRQILNRVQEWLKEPPRSDRSDFSIPAVGEHATQPVLTYREIIIDRLGCEARVEGRVVPLTRGEFILLSILAERPGVVFSRRRLVDATRGAEYAVEERSVDVQVFQLRRKLGSARRCIQTVRGFGYRFVGESPESCSPSRG